MEAVHALPQQQSDYDYVQWTGRPRLVPLPATSRPKVEIDTTRISLASDRELRYWTDEFRVTIYDIREAIAATASRCPQAVRHYLVRRRVDDSADICA